jgi:hypothetical protein
MSTKSNPGRFNCHAAAFPDETIFTLLARDPAFPATVEFWVSERIRLGKNQTEDDKARLSAALEESEAAANWRAANLDPMGDGTPTWRMPMHFVDDTTSRPVSTIATHEGDGTEAVRINRFWLHGLIEQLESVNNKDVAEVAELLSLARDSGLPTEFNGFNQPAVTGEYIDETRVVRTTFIPGGPAEHAMADLAPDEDGGRVPTADYQTVNGKLTDYGIAAWIFDRLVNVHGENPNYDYMHRLAKLRDDLSVFGMADAVEPEPVPGMSVAGLELVNEVIDKIDQRLTSDPNVRLSSKSRDWLEGIKRDLCLVALRQPTPAVDELGTMERVLVDEAPRDLAHSPEVPPHRFSVFHKGERYAYARGLEVAPIHLPVALDAMAKDGWELLAIFGQTDAKHVGFIFERRPVVVDSINAIPWPETDDARGLVDLYRRTYPGMAEHWTGETMPPAAPAIPEGFDAEIEVHIAATRQTHADDARSFLAALLCGAQWPVKARVVGLVDGQPERGFDIAVEPGHSCWEFGRGQEP